jgi:hypothetical protein
MKPQPNEKSASNYHTYLLKIWSESGQGVFSKSDWRFSLEDVQAGTRRGFRDLDALLVFLIDLTNPYPGPADPTE